MKLRRRREESLDSEIRDYIERETRANIETGMTPDDARHAAMRKLGPPLQVKEDTRGAWGWTWIERLWQDLVHGRRMLAKNPGFTAVAVVSIAIGIGANSAMFSLADALLLRPLPVLRPSEVMAVGTVETAGGFSQIVASYRDYIDFRDQSKSFDGLVAFADTTFGVAAKRDAVPQMKLGTIVSGNLFKVLGVEPELGRSFRPEEDQVPDRDAVLVLGHGYWENEFGADPSVLGRKLLIDGIEFNIIGVAPARFTGVNRYFDSAFYVPIMMWPRLVSNSKDKPLEARDYRQLTLRGRLKPGISVSQAQAEIAAIGKNLERAYPVTNHNQNAVVRTELQARIQQSPPDFELSAMLITLAIAVLLVACANVAGLLTSRAPTRAREIALRLAIGAGRQRLIRQLLTESLLIAIAGGLLGLLVGYGGVLFLQQIKISSDLPVKIAIELDRRVLLYSLALAAASAVLFGLVPAIQTTRTDLVNALRSATADAPGPRRLWGRNLLVAAQVAIALVLLTVTTFMYRGFHQDLGKGPGFRTTHLLMLSFDPRLVHYSDAQSQQFFHLLVERARSVPGVKSAALTYGVPMGNDGFDGATIVPEGYQFPKEKEDVSLFANDVGEGYFNTQGIQILQGRGFLPSDTDKSPRVAVVNEEVAKHYWPGQDAIGKRFRLLDHDKSWVEIVGVAKTIKYLWIGEAPTEFVYFPQTQRPQPRMMLLAESFGDPASLAAPLREAVHTLDANQPIYNVRTYDEFYHYRAVSTSNLIIEVVGAMGVMGMLLAMVGLYGLVAYAAGRRTREIGIRMAIGAPRISVLRMVMRQAFILALSGVTAGLVASVGAERVLNAMFSGTSTDFLTYLLVVPSLLAVTLFAGYIPARRASRVDPMKALRYE
ncbi:MAG TPA: ABC transporter permease [Bryobacteraceae bacterium]|nr:ABC transporter permease [Bryobacteraceae bacterium]